VSAFGALWRSTHPGPTLVVTALALALGASAGVAPGRLALLAVAVLCGQISVGISNDAIDAERDRTVGRRDKPIARGDVSVSAAWAVAVGALAAALVLSAPLGAGMLVAHAVALASAWAYNIWLKRTVASVVPFLVSFGLFPSLATLSALPPALAPVWASAAGSALGLAVHFTNVLSDLDDDARTGVRGLPHRLGVRAAAVTAFAAVAGGALAVYAGSGAGGAATVGLIVVLATAAGGLVTALVQPGRWTFRAVMLAALLLAVGLVVTGL